MPCDTLSHLSLGFLKCFVASLTTPTGRRARVGANLLLRNKRIVGRGLVHMGAQCHRCCEQQLVYWK